MKCTITPQRLALSHRTSAHDFPAISVSPGPNGPLPQAGLVIQHILLCRTKAGRRSRLVVGSFEQASCNCCDVRGEECRVMVTTSSSELERE